MSKQKVQVVMLPEDTIGYPSDMWQLGEYQHLYFLDNERGWRERLKDKDWFIFFPTDGAAELHQFHSDHFYGIKTYTKYNGGGSLVVSGTQCSGAIIASTDPALGLPVISTTWINDVFIPSNGSIKEVELETYRHIENVEVVNGVAPVYSDRLRLINNEVVIVDELDKPFTKDEFEYQLKHVVPSDQRGTWAKENWPKVVNPTKSIDQELEDAAKDHARYGGPFSIHKQNYEYMFKQGAQWQKQQSAEDIEKLCQHLNKYSWNHFDPVAAIKNWFKQQKNG